MQIEHVGLWVHDLEAMKAFYQMMFEAKVGERYENHAKGFQSYFLTFESGARLEIMHQVDQLVDRAVQGQYAHLAMSVDSREMVDQLVVQFKAQGLPLLNGPRVTGDGYYEAVVEDPEHNLIELTV
ncbi:VOC family protein [Latilactobacillus fuchuensis]|uniref:VOC family protein n=1 Tax=Latilactobacillus fuchuensis TaxID=164393 RepID=UPI0020C7C715|nr:VOC family protein [Latilactobacillus fuchuensis]MCP8857624.1 VOC family protein [Latilactobacillus fuchuensis]